MTCDCKACKNLLNDCGEELFDMYSRKLLLKGWAGLMSPVEVAYRKAHRKPRSEEQQAADAAFLVRMEAFR